MSAPLATVAAAIRRSVDGSTIVLRAGRYHESVIIPPGKRVTVQNYPGEAAWFDGSRTLTGWKSEGSVWRAPWPVKFDRSPTYLRGAQDNTEQSWQFVSEAKPLANYPEMVWSNDTQLTQVGSLAQVRPNTFWIDDVTATVVLGSDPVGKHLEGSALQTAISLRAPGTVLRGIGVRRYGSAVADQGVITSYFPKMTIDNVTVLDSGTGGIGMFERDNTIRNTTVRGAGQLAIQAGYADNLLLDNVFVDDANDEVFNTAPAAGGIKITKTRGVTLRNSRITNTNGHAFWADESCYGITVTGNNIHEATGNGIFLELSAKAVVANNFVTGTDADGISLRNTHDVEVWNNTVRSRTRAIDISQDYRKASDLNVTGHDDRQTLPDPTVTWIFGNIRVRNNVMEGGGDALILLGVQSYDHEYEASKRNITTNGNVYGWPTVGAPRWLVAWSRVGTDPYVATDLATFAKAYGQETSGYLLTGNSVFDAKGSLLSTIRDKTATIAEPLPTNVAATVAHPSGERHLGAWR